VSTPREFDEDFYLPGGLSNFDRSIADGIEEKLRSDPRYHAHYAGWHFAGYVWFEDDTFHCDVYAHHTYRETFTAETLRGLMDEVSSEHGYD
jgi:hypothetical protein